MPVYKVRVNENSIVTLENLILFFKELTKFKKYHLDYFFHKEKGTKLGNSHWQGFFETNLDLSPRQIQYQKRKQKIKDVQNAHSIVPTKDIKDGDRYKAYCTKDISRCKELPTDKISTNLSIEKVKDHMQKWDETYKPLSNQKKSQNLKGSEKLLLHLKQNEFQFLPEDRNISYEWHEDLFKCIVKYYHINCIFFDNYIIKKAMCLALSSYDPDYLNSILWDKWEDFVQQEKSI